MTSHRLGYQDGTCQLTGFLAWDDSSSGRRPGVMVVHGGAGLDAHAEKQARRLAALGYVVFACDMYGEGVVGNRERVLSCIGELRADRTRLSRRARAGLDVLGAHPLVDQRIAVVGYCFGGLVALELARDGLDVRAVVSIHGSLATTQPAEPGRIKAPMLVCHGALDPYAPSSDVSAFVDEMTRAGADWQLVIYGQAKHGFTHEEARGQMPGVLYDAASDNRSAAAIRLFLDEAFTKRPHAADG